MRVAVRVDASTESGLGHVKRSLALASGLRTLKAEVVFVTRDHGLETAEMVEAQGFCAHVLGRTFPAQRPPDDLSHSAWLGTSQGEDAAETCTALAGGPGTPDWIVVDHYGLDRRWHEEVASRLDSKVCIIDDIADRPLRGELLVDHNLDEDHAAKYAHQASAVRKILGGPRFALLGPSYVEAQTCEIGGNAQSIGIFMGGTDAPNASSLVLRAAREGARFAGPIEIATTSANPHLTELAALCRHSGETRLLIDQSDLSVFFARHAIQVGAGGGASWERCRVGSPTIALVCAENQRLAVNALVKHGIVHTASALTVDAIGREIAALLSDRQERHRLSEASRRLVDGRGAERVAVAMSSSRTALRPAVLADAPMVHHWRNAEGTRRYFRDPSAIALDDHLAWWSRSMVNSSRRLLIAEVGGKPVGVYRLDISDGSAEISLYVDPELHGLGLGRAILRAGQQWTRERLPALTRQVANVHPSNQASATSFRSAGFLSSDGMNWTWETRE